MPLGEEGDGCEDWKKAALARLTLCLGRVPGGLYRIEERPIRTPHEPATPGGEDEG